MSDKPTPKEHAIEPGNSANDYDAWFIAQVEASLNDECEALNDEQVEQLFATLRKNLRRRTGQ